MREASLRQRLIPLGIFFGSSFFFHLLWENVQAPLFAGYESFEQHFWICFRATWGDLLFMLTIYVALAVVHQDWLWIRHRTVYRHPATWMITLFFGLLLAANFELWAVYVNQRWQYAERMPMIPILHIGLTPVLQMMIIPLLSLLTTRSLSRS